jgi:hypothetical protein
MPQICDMGQDGFLLTLQVRRAENFFALKNPTASAGFEPANLGAKGYPEFGQLRSFVHFCL